jgi:hypothetical protein
MTAGLPIWFADSHPWLAALFFRYSPQNSCNPITGPVDMEGETNQARLS